MQIKFFKYQGTGNDFILIDNRTENVRLNSDQIAHLCNRKFGIGADGLMLLEQSNKYDFEMKYYNSDGHLGSMCGNGGRCIVQFAKDIDLVDENVMFLAVDGVHQAEILKEGLIDLEMNDVESIKKISEHVFELNTGSPHYIKFVNSFDSLNVVEEGRVIRNAETYLKEGINVNFVLIENNEVHIRTYERGVEDETLSCGTGVTAAAIASVYAGLLKKSDQAIKVYTRGGILQVQFEMSNTEFVNVRLIGPAIKSFEGEISI